MMQIADTTNAILLKNIDAFLSGTVVRGFAFQRFSHRKSTSTIRIGGGRRKGGTPPSRYVYRGLW
jgi:hypothetical protein